MNGAYLGVEASVLGRRWVGPGAEVERLGLAISQSAELPEIVGRVLARAGVDPAEATAYLHPTLRDLTPNPSMLKGMDAAAERLADAVRRGERISIFGDYDVDGAATSALVHRWLGAVGQSAEIYIPDRIDEGYGPNVPAMQALAKRSDLILCVDCGTLSFEPIAAARTLGADVLVADHHLAGETLPEATAVVNPNRQDDESEQGHLCAAGVAFLLLIAANRTLREGGWFQKAGVAQPDLRAFLDLVALATVADVAPLVGFNRALVRQGLGVMAARRNPGLRALADAARMQSAPTAFHLGFLLGPRINAGGRIGKADLGARLLTTDDPAEAEALAERLDALNKERRETEAVVLDAAIQQAEARGVDGPLVWAADKGWHPGVVGIVASRLKERYNRPAVVIGLEGGEGKGSGRSITGVDLGSAIAALARDGAILKGGGHKMAAGLTVAEESLEASMDRLGEQLARQGAGAGGPRDLRLDALLAPAAASVELCEMLEQAGPFGASAPAPRFAIPDARIAFAKPAGDSHLRLSLTGDGARGASGRLDAIAFRAFEGPLGDFLSQRAGAPVHVAGRLEIDDWGGRRKAKLRVEDAAPAKD